MRRRALLALLAALLLPSATGAAAPPASEAEQSCLDPAQATLCAAARVTLDLPCAKVEPGLVACYPRIDWDANATNPLGIPSQAEWSATALVEWCAPGGVCRSVGVSFRIATCDLGQQRACGGAATHTINLSNMQSPPGVCYDVVWSGMAYMGLYVPTAQVNRQVLEGPAIIADPDTIVTTNVCA